MQLPEHLFMVRASVDSGREDEFNRWYNEEHLPDVAKLPGCVGAARYRVIDGDGTHQYLAVYAFESEAALRAVIGSDHLNEMIKMYDEAVGSFSSRARATYEQIYSL